MKVLKCVQNLFIKEIVIEKLEEEIRRIRREYKEDECFTSDYIHGLITGLRNGIDVIKNI